LLVKAIQQCVEHVIVTCRILFGKACIYYDCSINNYFAEVFSVLSEQHCDWLLKQFSGAAPTTEVAQLLLRTKGALVIGEAITSLQAPGFLHARDKLALFTARIFVSLCHLSY